MLISAIIGSIINKDIFPNYLCSKTYGILAAIIFTVVFFYTYTGILGTHITLIDILLFFVSAIVAEIITVKKLIFSSSCKKSISFIILILLLISFITYTYFTPKIGLFEDPATKTYGIYGRN